ncbi:MAG: hypothetical protein EBS55_10900 [Flavobacteriaceae bacterium]|nr:hypothetical protein [Flavobacteriaceae bacterium]
MTKINSERIVELYPEMFTFTSRGYEHNWFEKQYNNALAYLHKKIKASRKIDYIQQTNPYKYEFAVGDGWFKILFELVGAIKVNDQKKGDWITKVTQIKEKFGGLRFYVTGTSDKNWALIRNAEQKSYGVCEESGSEVEVGTWVQGWTQTLCRQIALKRYYNKMDKNEFAVPTKFDDCWKPSHKAETIVTKKKK